MFRDTVDLNFSVFGFKLSLENVPARSAKLVFALGMLGVLILFLLLPFVLIFALNCLLNTMVPYGFWQWLGGLILLILFGPRGNVKS